MIYDTLKNIGNYRGLSKNMDRAIDLLLTTDFSALEAGTYEVDGREVYFSLQEPELRDAAQAQFEAHRSYIDIQYALADGEQVGWRALEQVEKWLPYDAEKDVLFSEVEDKGLRLPLNAGEFMVFFPSDAHMPCLGSGDAVRTRKVVVKIHV